MIENPKVFISYSDDSKEHTEWVANLGTYLRENGVDVILDQWDLRAGGDLALFMEQGISNSLRALSICSEEYSKKANKRARGVGYESMILSGSMLSEASKEFIIPIVRNNPLKILPIFLQSKKYIDFSNDDEFINKCQELLERIFDEDIKKKPSLGESPFSTETELKYRVRDFISKGNFTSGIESNDFKKACLANRLKRYMQIARHAECTLGAFLRKQEDKTQLIKQIEGNSQAYLNSPYWYKSLVMSERTLTLKYDYCLDIMKNNIRRLFTPQEAKEELKKGRHISRSKPSNFESKSRYMLRAAQINYAILDDLNKSKEALSGAIAADKKFENFDVIWATDMITNNRSRAQSLWKTYRSKARDGSEFIDLAYCQKALDLDLESTESLINEAEKNASWNTTIFSCAEAYIDLLYSGDLAEEVINKNSSRFHNNATFWCSGIIERAVDAGRSNLARRVAQDFFMHIRNNYLTEWMNTYKLIDLWCFVIGDKNSACDALQKISCELPTFKQLTICDMVSLGKSYYILGQADIGEKWFQKAIERQDYYSEYPVSEEIWDFKLEYL